MEGFIRELLTAERLDDAARLWNTRAADLKLLRAFENFVYEFERDGRSLIFRLTHSSHRSRQQVEAELHWLNYVAEMGIEVAAPLPSQQGRLVEEVAAGESSFMLSCFHKAPGAHLRNDDPLLKSPDFIRHWGHVMGKLHALASAYRPPSDAGIRRPHWYEEDLLLRAADYIPKEHHFVVERLADMRRWMENLPTEAPHFGMLHLDFHRGNYFVDQGRITLFDFDDCGPHWLAYDIAITLHSVQMFSPPSAAVRDRECSEFARYFLDGYVRAHPFDSSWKTMIPAFMHYRDLIIFSVMFKKRGPEGWADDERAFLDQRIPAIRAGRSFAEIDWRHVFG